MLDDMKVHIENLGKYNENYPQGGWFAFPLDYEEIAECIGLNCRYEEYMISDCVMPCSIPDYATIEQLNDMYDRICELPEHIVDNLDDFIDYYGNLEAVCEHIDDIILYADCETMEDVACFCAKELQSLGEIPSYLQNYIDYEAYGRDLEIEGYFIETSCGMCEIQR